MLPDPGPEQETAYYRVHHTPGGNATFYNFPNDFSHICNLNLRCRLVLSEIDKIPFAWYHVQAVAVTGANFFADSYDLFTINSTIQLLGCRCPDSILSCIIHNTLDLINCASYT